MINMKIKIIEGDEKLFSSEKTQIGVLEIPEDLVDSNEVIQRARNLIAKTGSSSMSQSFESALRKRRSAKRDTDE